MMDMKDISNILTTEESQSMLEYSDQSFKFAPANTMKISLNDGKELILSYDDKQQKYVLNGDAPLDVAAEKFFFYVLQYLNETFICKQRIRQALDELKKNRELSRVYGDDIRTVKEIEEVIGGLCK